MSKPTNYVTSVTNTCGGRRLFAFLPPHGVELEDGETITYPGEITTRMIPSWPYHTDKKRPPNPRKVESLRKAEEAGDLLVLRQYPAKIHELTNQFRSRPLGYVDPSWSPPEIEE